MSTSLIGKRLGNYDIQAKIGEGGMGAVYMGVHPSIGKKVAIKVLHEELASKADVVQRFFNEAKAVNDISHPNIVDIIDFGDTMFDGAACKYIIMEFLDGESLSARMRREGVTIRESLNIVAQCAAALSASHGKGVIHRDLKPENVFLVSRHGDRNYVKLLDFGIAKLTSDQGAAMSQHTRTGMVIGTPTYMSPEQCDGKGQIDQRADIYALGVMMFELLTGRVPFQGEGFGEVLVAHLTREPDPPRSINANIPQEIEAIVLRCLRKRKDERFQTMNDMLAALQDPMPHLQSFLQGLPAPTSTGQPPMPMMSGVMPVVPGPMSTGGLAAVGPAGAGRNQSAVWAAAGPGMPPMMPAHGPGSGMQPMQMGPSGPMRAAGPGMPAAAGVVMTPGLQSGLVPGLSPDMLPVPGGGVGPRSTTLSGASAEQGGRRRPLSILIGFAGAMLLGSLTVVGIKLAGKDRGAAVVVPIDDKVTISITSNPPAAEVLRSDVETAPEATPLKFQVKKGTTPIDLKISLPGYKDEVRRLTPTGSQAIEVTMTKDAPPVPAPDPDPPPVNKTGPKKPKDKPVSAPLEDTSTRSKDPGKTSGKTPKTKEPKQVTTDAKPTTGSKPKKPKPVGDGVLRPHF